MKTLILSCNTGEGHNSCAKAIKEYYDSKGCACDIKDGLEFISPGISNFISRGHSFIYCRIPWLFKLTKPGGISVSEASIKNVPMVFIDAVAGCEKYNGQFFADFNCAQTCASVSDIAKTCISIMQKEEKCIAMGHELQKLKKENSARVIYEIMDKQETCRYG